MIAAVAKPVEPREPGADAIPAEIVLGKEETEGEGSAPIEPATTRGEPQPAARVALAAQKPAGLSKGDRLFVIGIVAVVITGGAAYAFRNEISAQYERRVHPERYWSKEVNNRQFALKLSQIQEQECLVDLLAARMKEPINAARSELLGASSSEARQWAAEETASQEQACSAFADFVKADRERLAAAERELAGVRSK